MKKIKRVGNNSMEFMIRSKNMNSPYKGKFRVSQQYKGSAHDGLDLVGVDSKNIYSTVDGLVEYAHVEGSSNKVYCNNVHVEGLGNTAMNSNAGHVGGWKNTINGDTAFAHGHGLKATGTCSFVVGRYNVESNASTPTLSNAARFIVGNGTTDSNRSNAFTVYADGHGEIQTQGTTDISLV